MAVSYERLRESVVAFGLCGLFFGCVAGSWPVAAVVVGIGSGIGIMISWWRLQRLNDRERNVTNNLWRTRWDGFTM